MRTERERRTRKRAFDSIQSAFKTTVLVACGFASLSSNASACPFCTAVAPSLAQEREAADVVALAEATDATATPPRFRLHRVTKGANLLANREAIAADIGTILKQGELVLLFGRERDGTLHWSGTVVNETSAAYFFHAPSMREPEVDRLKYFSSFLEHPDPTIAEDAYREFGHARFDVVAKVVDHLPSDRVRKWLLSDRVPQTRKGLYGLVLGLIPGESERRANADFLKKLILADENDFRAGFDGVLGGYLLLAGNNGLQLIETRLLANPKAAVGDVRHAMTALRFYHEYSREIPAQRLSAALAKVLIRPEFAEAAITDLARWQAWEFCDQIAGLYEQPAFSATEIRRAIVGYLLACPQPAAAKQLARIRENDPVGVAAAEEVLSKLGKLPQ